MGIVLWEWIAQTRNTLGLNHCLLLALPHPFPEAKEAGAAGYLLSQYKLGVCPRWGLGWDAEAPLLSLGCSLLIVQPLWLRSPGSRLAREPFLSPQLPFGSPYPTIWILCLREDMGQTSHPGKKEVHWAEGVVWA